MKHRISITLDENILIRMKERIRLDSTFDSQSNFVEKAIKEKVDKYETPK
jgi:metal-responsive CopG/Arc/MetJ family transcriptional regulator